MISSLKPGVRFALEATLERVLEDRRVDANEAAQVESVLRDLGVDGFEPAALAPVAGLLRQTREALPVEGRTTPFALMLDRLTGSVAITPPPAAGRAPDVDARLRHAGFTPEQIAKAFELLGSRYGEIDTWLPPAVTPEQRRDAAWHERNAIWSAIEAARPIEGVDAYMARIAGFTPEEIAHARTLFGDTWAQDLWRGLGLENFGMHLTPSDAELLVKMRDVRSKRPRLTPQEYADRIAGLPVMKPAPPGEASLIQSLAATPGLVAFFEGALPHLDLSKRPERVPNALSLVALPNDERTLIGYDSVASQFYVTRAPESGESFEWSGPFSAPPQRPRMTSVDFSLTLPPQVSDRTDAAWQMWKRAFWSEHERRDGMSQVERFYAFHAARRDIEPNWKAHELYDIFLDSTNQKWFQGHLLSLPKDFPAESVFVTKLRTSGMYRLQLRGVDAVPGLDLRNTRFDIDPATGEGFIMQRRRDKGLSAFQTPSNAWERVPVSATEWPFSTFFAALRELPDAEFQAALSKHLAWTVKQREN